MTVEEALGVAKQLEPQLYKLGIELEKTCAGILSTRCVLKKHRPDLGKYKLLGFGISRLVIGVGPYAVKYQFAGRQNQHEWGYWKAVKDTEYAKYYMPILYCRGKYLVMPKGVVNKKAARSERMARVLNRAASKVEDNHRLWQVLSGTGYDLHDENLCMYENRIRVLDYGI